MIFMHSPTLAGLTNKVVDFSNSNNTGNIYLRVSRLSPASCLRRGQATSGATILSHK